MTGSWKQQFPNQQIELPLLLSFHKVYLYFKVLVCGIGQKAFDGPVHHWKNAVDEARRLYETVAAYPYFNF